MSGASHIEWTDATWNPVTGCTRVSAGCDHCYAVRHTRKLAGAAKGAVGQPALRRVGERYLGLTMRNAKGDLHFNGEVRCHKDLLDWPLRQKKPLMIFVNSMSDLFHEKVPFKFIAAVFTTMSQAGHHTFQILTKRPDRMAEFFLWNYPPEKIGRADAIADWRGCWPNVWLGTSVEDQKTADERIPHLLTVPAAVRFLSVEPMLGPIEFRHDDPYPWVVDLLSATRAMPDCDDPKWDFGGSVIGGIDWVICGGESGPGARPMHPDWVRSVRDQCAASGVPFFFKQWGEWIPGEPDAQPPFWQFQNGECIDSHSFPDLTSGDPPNGWLTDIGGAEDIPDQWIFRRVGKKRAGVMLDGQLHRQWPKVEVPA